MMTHHSSASERSISIARRQVIVAVVLCVVTAALAWITRDLPLEALPPAGGLVLLSALYVILLLLAVWSPTGVYVGFQDVAVIAAFLSFGPLPALGMLCVGATITQALHILIRQRTYPLSHAVAQGALRWLSNVGVSGYSTLLAGTVFYMLDGRIPLRQINLSMFPTYGVLFMAHATLHIAAIALLTGFRERRPERRSGLSAFTRLFYVEVVTIPLALLVTASYNNTQVFGSHLIVVAITIITAALFRVAEISQRNLVDRVNELATLNSIGQALAANLSLPDLLQSIYEQVTRLLDTQTFYIALHDPENQTLTFALAVRNGNREFWKPRQMTNGATEYVIRTAKPLMVSGTLEEVDRKLGALGIERQGLPALCYLGVPIIVEQEVMGVISVQSHTNPNAYGPAEATLLATFASQAAIALRNANLYNRIYELADKLALINNVSSLVTASLDLDHVLKTICSVVIEVGYADKAGIFLSSERDMTLRLAQSIGLSEDYVAQFQEIVRTDDSGPMQVMRQTEPMAISDVHTDSRGLGWRTLAEIEGYTGLLTVPLIASETVIGFMAVFYQQYHLFTKAELDLMSTLANHVAVAVANARLYDDTQARAGELSRLVDASRAFTASLNLESVAEQVFLEIDDLLRPDAITIGLLDHGGNFSSIAQRGDIHWSAVQPEGTIGAALRISQPVMLPRDSEDLELLHQLNLSSLYVLPLVSQDKAFGALLVGHKQPRRFSSRERQLVEAMANQAATAIRNAQLFSQVDEALADRVTELSAIEAISRKISGALKLDTIIDDVLKAALEATNAAHVAFILPAEDPNWLTFFERSRNSGITRNRMITSSTGIVGRVLRTGVIARVDDVRADADYYQRYAESVSELCVPITHQGTIAGAINVESPRLAAFTPSHERFMVNLAQHVAIALNNTQLFEERQQQIETLTRLRKFSLDLLSASSLNQGLHLIADCALTLTGADDAHVYLYDRRADLLLHGATVSRTGHAVPAKIRPVMGTRMYEAACAGQMNFVEALSDEGTATTDRAIPGEGAAAWLPLKRADKVLGVLVIAFRGRRFFNDSDTRIFDLLASQAAIAVENASLFEEVRAGRDQMQLILDSTRDGIVLIDANGSLIVSNQAAEQLLGYPLHLFHGANVLRLVARVRREATSIPNLDFWVDQIHTLLDAIKRAPEEPTRREFEVMSGDTRRYIDETTLPVRNGETGLMGRLIVMRDVTRENELKRMQDEVSDMLVHDLRSPLSGVISSLRLVEDMLDIKDYEDIPHVINIALSSSETQLRMIESLMDIRKWRTGRMPLNPTKCSLNRMIEKVLTTLNAMANEANIQTRNLVTPDFPLLRVDEDLISRVLFNLVDNALRHTPNRGEIRLEANLEHVNGNTEPHMARVSVTDTGRGIPPEARERVFEMFVQVPKSALRGHRGSGLGLTFCKLTVEAHGGKIWVGSGPEGGASFMFTLPLVREDEVEPQGQSEP